MPFSLLGVLRKIPAKCSVAAGNAVSKCRAQGTRQQEFRDLRPKIGLHIGLNKGIVRSQETMSIRNTKTFWHQSGQGICQLGLWASRIKQAEKPEKYA
jgi:hypothetical protein